MDYKSLLTSDRRKISSSGTETPINALASDRSRIIYSSSFRRLQRKAQVFPLEDNSSVRTRLTHSLEVSDLGRRIAQKIVDDEKFKIDSDLKTAFVYAVENACLLHDIGNPPFGHFGEKAIRDWFTEKWEFIFKKAVGENEQELENFSNNYVPDFIKFDGNPQGFRIATKLQRERDDIFGMNLTYTTLLSSIKYVVSPKSVDGKALKKKPGYFISEEDIVKEAKEKSKIGDNSRFPLAYLMEIADDISYCISDIEDGLEKEIITPREFFDDLSEAWKGESKEGFPGIKEIENGNPTKLDMFNFKINFTIHMTKAAASKFIDNQDKIFKGEVESLFGDNDLESKALKCLKKVSRMKLFRSREAENPELAGYSIIYGILNCFKPLLCVERNIFSNLIQKEFDKVRDSQPKDEKDKYDLHMRLANRLPEKYRKVYLDELKESDNTRELFLRSHLIVDFISGMTDLFALETYQLLHGIRIR